MLVISRTPIVRAPLLVVASVLAFASGSAQAVPDVFVDENASGLNNGLSWPDAYVDLQDGLGDAGPGETVFVAKGTYWPNVSPIGGGGGIALKTNSSSRARFRQNRRI